MKTMLLAATAALAMATSAQAGQKYGHGGFQYNSGGGYSHHSSSTKITSHSSSHTSSSSSVRIEGHQRSGVVVGGFFADYSGYSDSHWESLYPMPYYTISKRDCPEGQFRHPKKGCLDKNK